MAVTSMRIPEKYDHIIKDYLKVTGQSFTNFAIEAMMDKIEDAIDIKAYEEAMKENEGQGTISHDEMKAELGL